MKRTIDGPECDGGDGAYGHAKESMFFDLMNTYLSREVCDHGYKDDEHCGVCDVDCEAEWA